MTAQPFSEAGGVAGVFAVTEDMVAATQAIMRAGACLGDVSRLVVQQERVLDNARHASSSQTDPYVWRADASLVDVRTGPQGSMGTEAELMDVATRVVRAAQHYLDAEVAAQRAMTPRSTWGAASDSIFNHWWNVRHVAAGVWKYKVGKTGALAGGDPVGDWLRPDGLPRTVEALNRDNIQFFMTVIGPERYRAIAWSLAHATASLEVLFGEPRRLRVEQLMNEPAMPVPTGIGDVLAGVAQAHSGHRGVVGIQSIVQPDGTMSYVVMIPGTEDWLFADGNEFDTQGNAAAAADMTSDAMTLVVDAMDMAGIPPGAPVMLAGHSQGGMNAVALAASAAFREKFTVTHVVTAGSPTGTFDRPKDVEYLHLENPHDVVPGLSPAAPPDLPNTTTVHVDFDVVSADVVGDPRTIVGAHDLAGYTETATYLDANPGSSSQHFIDSASNFFAPDATAHYREYAGVFDESAGTIRRLD